LLADHSKLGFRAPAVVAPAQMVGTLMTDEVPSESLLEQLRACGMEIKVVGEQVFEPGMVS
jgi:DeoR/GlpR family transcriptional regulator of sugar metabolism